MTEVINLLAMCQFLYLNKHVQSFDSKYHKHDFANKMCMFILMALIIIIFRCLRPEKDEEFI